MAEYIFIAESGADIPQAEAKRLGIEIVPMHVTFASKSFDDGTFPAERIFDHYAATGELPATSGCTPGDFTQVFDRLHQEHPEAHLVYLAYSAATTCSFESAHIAGEGRDYITYIDTKSVCAGQYMVATKVAQFAKDNPGCSVEDIKQKALQCVDAIKMIFIPGELKFLRAGGRLSNAAFLGATLLHIKPVIEILDGRLVATEKRRGSMERVVKAALQDFLTRHAMDHRRIAFIRNRGLSEKVQQMAEDMALAEGFQEFVWIDTGCVISSHCGPGSFGVAAFEI